MPQVENIQIQDAAFIRGDVAGQTRADSREIDVVFATTTPYRRRDYSNNRTYDEILVCDAESCDLSALNLGAPFLDNHDSYSANDVLGKVTKAWIEDGKCMATILLSSRDSVKGLTDDILNGIITGISVGYRVMRYEATEPQAGSDVWTYKATKWIPREISCAPVQADPNSNTGRSEGQNPQTTVELVNPTPKPSSKMTDEERKAAADEATRKAAEDAARLQAEAAAEKARKEAQLAEKKRVKEITDLVRTQGLAPEIADQLIESDATLDAARSTVLEELAKKKNVTITNHNTGVGSEGNERWRKDAENYLLMRSGESLNELAGLTPEERKNAESFKGATLSDLARHCLRQAGDSAADSFDRMEIAKRALTSDSSDFAVLLEGTNRRKLLAAYNAQGNLWREFCGIDSVQDFRDYKRVKMASSFNELDAIQENSEYNILPIADGEQETIRVSTKGNTINITRKMIVNDDLSAFTRLASMFGAAAARSIELDVFRLLVSNSYAGPVMSDTYNLFDATNHGNVAATPAALSVTALDAIRVQMRKTKQVGGKVNDYLDIVPKILLVPTEMRMRAQILNTALYDPDQSTKLQYPNGVNGMFDKIIDTPRLSGTRWYVLANPAEVPAINVAFLNGVQTPYMESDQPFEVDGLRWKVRMDYGVNAVDWRGIATNAGA